jgi:hypothetical protein
LEVSREAPVPARYEAGWTTGMVWELKGRESFFLPEIEPILRTYSPSLYGLSYPD